MDVSVVHRTGDRAVQIADQNRQMLHDAGVFAVNIIGAAGCGKTTLVGETLTRLMLAVRIGVVACDPTTRRDAERLAGSADQTVQVDTGEGNLLEPQLLQEALHRLDLGRLDLLLVENVSSLIIPVELDLGEHAKAAVFSAADGDDKAVKYGDVVRRADILVLNKMDLVPSVPFDLAAFRAETRRLNPVAPLLEMSVLKGEGLDAWLDWLKGHLLKALPQQSRPSEWFG